MFNIFKKKEESIPVIDRIWIKEEYKWKACLEKATNEQGSVFIAWFEESRNKLEEYFSKNNIATARIILAPAIHLYGSDREKTIFIEHYPLRTREQNFFKELGLTKTMVFSSLDEPLFKKFGSDKIIAMIQQFGMKESDMIEHSMISGAIRKAQEKIEKQLSMDSPARSQQDWINRNYSG